jgi:ribonuclease HI
MTREIIRKKGSEGSEGSAGGCPIGVAQPLRAVAYVDGGCAPNPGRGGWSEVLVAGEENRELVGGEENSTNQRAEIMAAIMALEALDAPAEVEIVSDSQYLTNEDSQAGEGRENAS